MGFNTAVTQSFNVNMTVYDEKKYTDPYMELLVLYEPLIRVSREHIKSTSK